LRTDPDGKTDRLRSMMRTYESPHHSVVAFCLSGGAAGFLHSGVHLEDTPPEDVIFEIGSITKVFTGVLLCLLVEEGKVDPCAPRHAHSNLGVGLLGDAMAMQAGKPFMELLTETVIAPLGSKDTTGILSKTGTRPARSSPTKASPPAFGGVSG
jgi:CubicO group peptidase (beta-lactamase class C family)